MKLAVIGVGKWGLTIIGRCQNKVLTTTLPLGRLQQSAHASRCIKGVFL
jgi:hypothetical protein